MTTTRFRWMDLLRGTAIVMVLVWHAPAIPVLYGLEMPEWVRTTNNFFLPFRMPMLMFLSGSLLSHSIKRPLPEYLLGKVALIGWPYLVWAGLHIIQGPSNYVLTSPWSWVATGYLWFLFFIGTYYCMAPFIRRLPAWLVSVASFAASVPFDGELAKGFFYFLGFFYAGNFFTQRQDVFGRLGRGWPLAVCAVVAIGVGVWSSLNGVESKYEAITAPGSLAGIMVAMAAAKALPDSRLVRAVEGIGRKSIVYYVSHFPIIIVTTVALLSAGVESSAVVTAVGLVTAFIACAVLARFSSLRPLVWLYQMPGFPALRRRLRASDSKRPRSAGSANP
ncbi:acyltransferase family protein [Arthrobacter rhombi]|uniref:acyltransferase family protein n=1 Tax=Arthrobacter rhombi TaxID=71253 RepID=UPI00356A9CB4